jgi:hypothetical protein
VKHEIFYIFILILVLQITSFIEVNKISKNTKGKLEYIVAIT